MTMYKAMFNLLVFAVLIMTAEGLPSNHPKLRLEKRSPGAPIVKAPIIAPMGKGPMRPHHQHGIMPIAKAPIVAPIAKGPVISPIGKEPMIAPIGKGPMRPHHQHGIMPLVGKAGKPFIPIQNSMGKRPIMPGI